MGERYPSGSCSGIVIQKQWYLYGDSLPTVVIIVMAGIITHPAVVL